MPEAEALQGSPRSWTFNIPRRLGTRSRPVLSPRVRRELIRYDRTSEILSRIIQIVVVSIFAALFLLSPKTSDAPSLVPVALGLYLSFSLIGLIWSWRAHVPDWAVYGSILIDTCLLMVLILSFHIQYQQPPSFYLKAPTFLYVFIFIALRALRFEPRYVLATGAAAIVGWIAMLGYVLWEAEGQPVVTRDYVRYLTSNSILIGAEVDKLVTVALVAGILGLGLSRARGLLIQTATQQFAAEKLSRFFDASVADEIILSPDLVLPGTGCRRTAAVMYVDIRGFTDLTSRMDPDEIVKLLTAYQDIIVPIARRHHGAIDKFLGDGILVTFGAVRSSDDFAAQAMRTVDEILSLERQWPRTGPLARLHPSSINLAVASGPVVFGTVGSGQRLEYTVIGAPVNLAAKLEKENKRVGSRALATSATVALARRQGYAGCAARPALTIDVEGERTPLEIVRIG